MILMILYPQKFWRNLLGILVDNDFLELPITIAHTQCLYQLPLHHNDPFDRIMIAQAISKSLVFLTRDAKILLYPVSTLLATS
jgi:PIN domain nuclease of toxin-antitoxin system